MADFSEFSDFSDFTDEKDAGSLSKAMRMSDFTDEMKRYMTATGFPRFCTIMGSPRTFSVPAEMTREIVFKKITDVLHWWGAYFEYKQNIINVLIRANINCNRDATAYFTILFFDLNGIIVIDTERCTGDYDSVVLEQVNKTLYSYIIENVQFSDSRRSDTVRRRPAISHDHNIKEMYDISVRKNIIEKLTSSRGETLNTARLVCQLMNNDRVFASVLRSLPIAKALIKCIIENGENDGIFNALILTNALHALLHMTDARSDDEDLLLSHLLVKIKESSLLSNFLTTLSRIVTMSDKNIQLGYAGKFSSILYYRLSGK